MSQDAVKIGVVGCGDIAQKAYLPLSKTFPILEIVALADLDTDRARAVAKEHGVPDACSTEELIARDDVEIVLNLTTPKAHTPVNLAALEAGKHVYTEKPLAVTREEGKAVLELAEQKGLRVGSAPDTVLGAGHQTARKLIDDGVIGKVVACDAFMMGRGHEHWHPSPEFYYEVGGGPMMDMGPYYLTALTMLLGPVERVTGSAKILKTPRTILSEPKKGKTIDVETPDHLAGTLDFQCGAVGTIVTSFAVQGHMLPRIEVHGTEGSIQAPDPNGFAGPVKLLTAENRQWEQVPLSHPYQEPNYRSLGVADMAAAIRSGRAHRCTGRQAYHVLDITHGFIDASDSGQHYQVPSRFESPPAMPTDAVEGQLD